MPAAAAAAGAQTRTSPSPPPPPPQQTLSPAASAPAAAANVVTTTTSPPSRAQDHHDPESPSLGRRPGPWPPRMDNPSSNARILGSWARRTGFRSNISGESVSSITSEPDVAHKYASAAPATGAAAAAATTTPVRNSNNSSSHSNGKPLPKRSNFDTESNASGGNHRHYRESEADVMSQSQDDDALTAKQSHMKYELTDTPGLFPLVLYGLQHYFSIAGSIVLTPMVFVPAMGGSHEDTAKVVSTMLLISGVTTLLHSYFGSRLPLVQGSSFIYLAPVLAIIFSPEFAATNENRFKHIMRELQGAVIISSVFQIVMGYSGLMAFVIRVINPVVVAPTVAAVGLAFFSYAFPVIGSCIEVGLPQILIILFFALYLRKISLFGHRIFQVYAVPLGLCIIWAYAFLLTETGAYSFKGCNMEIPSSGIVPPECRKHVFTMRHCRTDASNALKAAAWFRFPYPFQWGAPRFHFRTGLVMMAASVIATVDSVGTYHATSLLVATRAPSPGVVSRSIGLEGLTSALAGIWGTGFGATTLTENVHTIAVTKIGSRRAVDFGACVLIMLALIGKIGALIASIPQVIVASLLCFMWALVTALGLSNLRYSETGSSRNVLIVGLALFMALSVPAYFQQYGGGSAAMNGRTELYFQPYAVGQHGPFKTKHSSVNIVLNSVLSMHMVIAFLVAFVLDNTVPGSRLERGVYVWCRPRTAKSDSLIANEYGLPRPVRRFFRWVNWVGL